MSVSSSSSAVDGLISGLDTTSIISKLLQVDAAPQTALKSSLSEAQVKVASYQAINTKLAALQAATDTLQSSSTWGSAKASSTDTTMSVTATSGAVPAGLSVEVDQLAVGRSVISNNSITLDSTGKITSTADSNGNVSTGTNKVPLPMSIVRSDGSYVTINPSSGTLTDVVSAINKAGNMGLSAVAIRTGDNSYRLQITSTTTGGTAGDFAVVAGTDSSGAASGKWTGSSDTTNWGTSYAGLKSADTLFQQTAAAQDASIQVGPTGAQSTVTSSTNTFADIMPGVSLTVSQLSPATSDGSTTGTTTASGVTRKAATVTVAKDPSAIANAVQNLVNAANAALKEISTQTAAGTVSPTGAITGAGNLHGDTTLRSLKNQVLSAVTSALGSNGTSAATLGLQSTSTGSLTFDPSKFLAAYAANPASVAGLVSSVAAGTSVSDGTATGTTSASDGLVERLRKVTVYAVGDVKLGGTTASGVLTSAITGQNSSITDLTRRISDWDTRLADKKAYYQKYYANLETALQTSKSQASWLSGQLSSSSSSS